MVCTPQPEVHSAANSVNTGSAAGVATDDATAAACTASRFDRRLRLLALAQACVCLGARVRTITCLTGVPHREVLRHFFPERRTVPRGRSPDSPEWHHTTNLLDRAEASIVLALYCRLQAGGLPPVEALLGAYRHYLGVRPPPQRVSFDRAFDLVAHTDARWLVQERSFAVITCPHCQAEHLTAIGTVAHLGGPCPFCALVGRYRRDQRLQASFPTREMVLPSAGELGMRELLRGRSAAASDQPCDGGTRSQPCDRSIRRAAEPRPGRSVPCS